MENNDVYIKAVEKLGYPGSESGVNYLKLLMTPEECKLLCEFVTPATCQEVTERLKINEQSLQAKLDDFVRRRLLRHGKTQYHFQFGFHVSFNDLPQMLKNEELPLGFWQVFADFTEEELEKYWMPAMTERAENTTVPGSRVIPNRLALDASPKIRPEQVLWYEDYHELLKKIGNEIPVTDCPCRQKYHNCDRAIHVCFATKVEPDPEKRFRTEVVSLEQAIALSDQGEKDGLVHLTPFPMGNHDLSVSGRGAVACNCCACCCTVLKTAIQSGRLRQLYSPSRYLAVVDTDRCKGCQECTGRCFFNAITMRNTSNSPKKKAHVLPENCMGCGSCIVGCKQKAITFELVRPPEHIPSEKTVTPVKRGYFSFSRSPAFVVLR